MAFYYNNNEIVINVWSGKFWTNDTFELLEHCKDEKGEINAGFLNSFRDEENEIQTIISKYINDFNSIPPVGMTMRPKRADKFIIDNIEICDKNIIIIELKEF